MEYRTLQIYFFLALLIGALIIAFFIFRPFIGPLLLGATFAIIFEPLHRRIVAALPGRESLSALFALVIVLVVVLTPLVFLGFKIFDEARALYGVVVSAAGAPNTLTILLSDTLSALTPYGAPISPEYVSETINQYITHILTWIVQNFGLVFSNVAKVAFDLLITLFALYYFFKDGRKLRSALIAMSPLSDHYDKEIFEKLFTVVNSVVKGTLAIAVIQGILAGIGFLIFGVPQAALWGSLTAVTALIPVLGTALVTLPAVAYLFLIGKTVSAVGLLLWVMIFVGTIDNFLRPKLIERGVRLHPFLILLSVLGGVGLFGPIGFLLGPLFLSLLFALLDIYRREFREYLTAHP